MRMVCTVRAELDAHHGTVQGWLVSSAMAWSRCFRGVPQADMDDGRAPVTTAEAQRISYRSAEVFVTDEALKLTQLSAYAMRDLNTLQRKASVLRAYAAAVLEHPLPNGLVRRHGAAVDDAYRRAALDAEIIAVGLLGRMPRIVRTSTDVAVRRPS